MSLNSFLTGIEEAFTEPRRKFLYKLAALGAAIAAYHGFISGDVAMQLVGVFALVFGMADVNVPTSATGKHRPEAVQSGPVVVEPDVEPRSL